MLMINVPGTFAHPSSGRRRLIRYIAAGLSGVVGVLYLILLFLVAEAEAVPGAAEGNTYGAYLFLAVPYLIGAGLLAILDHRALWAIGAVLQVLVFALFVIFGVGLLGPGIFEYEALRELSMPTWAVVITGSQVILFSLLFYLALTPINATTSSVVRASPKLR